MGCKRILFSNDYYPALTRNNVGLVTAGIAQVRPHAIVTRDGQLRETDTLILATGFHATDSPAVDLITGTDGRTLGDRWRNPTAGPTKEPPSPASPNLFLLVGPNTGTGNISAIYMIESQLNYLLDALRLMDHHRLAVVDVHPQAQLRYNRALQARMRHTVWASGCSSWYQDSHGRNATLWPSFAIAFRTITRHFDLDAYRVAARHPRAAHAELGVP